MKTPSRPIRPIRMSVSRSRNVASLRPRSRNPRSTAIHLGTGRRHLPGLPAGPQGHPLARGGRLVGEPPRKATAHPSSWRTGPGKAAALPAAPRTGSLRGPPTRASWPRRHQVRARRPRLMPSWLVSSAQPEPAIGPFVGIRRPPALGTGRRSARPDRSRRGTRSSGRPGNGLVGSRLTPRSGHGSACLHSLAWPCWPSRSRSRPSGCSSCRRSSTSVAAETA